MVKLRLAVHGHFEYSGGRLLLIVLIGGSEYKLLYFFFFFEITTASIFKHLTRRNTLCGLTIPCRKSTEIHILYERCILVGEGGGRH